MTAALTILPDPPPPPTPIGLIAGAGRLPVMVAENLKRLGHPVHVVSLGGLCDPSLAGLCDSLQPVALLRIGSWARALRSRGVAHAIMVGRVDKAKVMYDPLRLLRYVPDLRTIKVWFKHMRHDKRSHALLEGVARELERDGIVLLDSTAPIPDQLAGAGVMTTIEPSGSTRSDMQFAWPLLQELLRLDIGQALCVREKDVVAVEGIEGTDRMIERAGELTRGRGFVLCKGARAGHDRRSDVPTVGMQTLENLAKAGGNCLALAAGDVIMIDKVKMIQRADELRISIVGIPAGTASAMKAGL
jgi:DUF1009 family protein